MNRMRTTAAVLGAVGALTATQLGLAGAASAAPQAAGCPIELSSPKNFTLDAKNRVQGGLYFALKNKSKTASFKDVSLKVSKPVNLTFTYATATKGSKITKRTSKVATVYTKTLKKKGTTGLRISAYMTNRKKPYEVRFTVHGKTAAGKTWGCAVDQGWWGSIKH
ncbi:hypothetical protein SAMN04487980_1004107 [Streptomyces sp. cf124]|uniref:Lipoprotein n=2 Tax=Streptomyces caniscabiei TaxID=2746961 RepID=A0A927QFH5_9ACTN|nr:hypothetical protein [Streptomyces caniscabiei]UJV43636.1 hypothetical protein CVT30_30735 [Streptomyces sp. AMCC400023]SFM69339.1 hypothetical protein SAMN04487980_1004107 [Streptomyces sp. cf124]MBD9723615.1 hypothetical protein [Streptomyces caniscabiei]MBE4737781.1 hypothetical protein [Streptomyces caniscabiei]